MLKAGPNLSSTHLLQQATLTRYMMSSFACSRAPVPGNWQADAESGPGSSASPCLPLLKAGQQLLQLTSHFNSPCAENGRTGPWPFASISLSGAARSDRHVLPSRKEPGQAQSLEFSLEAHSPSSYADESLQPRELFSLARAIGPGSSDGIDDEDDEDEDGSSQARSDELDVSSEEELRRLSCGICKRSLVPARGKSSARSNSAQHVPHLRICDGCHTPFHAACCRRKGRGERVKGGVAGDAWYCSSGCQTQHNGLLQQCERGDCPAMFRPRIPSKAQAATSGDTHVFDGPASWQLAQGSAERGGVQWRGVADALSVLSKEYGPFVMTQIEGSDWVAVLRRNGVPVSALTLDCFGTQQGCLVDLASTRSDARLQGNMRALISMLEHFLHDSASTERLMAVVAEPHSDQGQQASQVWQRHLAYNKMSNRQVHKLQEDVPALSLYGSGISVYSKRLGSTLPAPALEPHTHPVHLTLGQSDHDGTPGKVTLQVTVGEGPADTKNVKLDDVAEAVAKANLDGESPAKQRRHGRSNWRFRLWGWVLKKALSASTFGLLG